MRGKAGRIAFELALLITCSPCAGLPVKTTSTAEISAASYDEERALSVALLTVASKAVAIHDDRSPLIMPH